MVDPNKPQTAFRMCVVNIKHALDHTAQNQYKGWEIASQKITETYQNSPLSRCDALNSLSYNADDMWRKMVAHNADHVKDV
jgi:hypothetical protein